MLIQFRKTQRKQLMAKNDREFRPYTSGKTARVRSALDEGGGLKSLLESGGAPERYLLNELQRLVGRKDAFVAEELKIALEELADTGVDRLSNRHVNEIVTEARKRIAVADFEKSLEQRIRPQTKTVRRIRTPEGARRYGQPIGTIITRDMIEAVGDPDVVDKPDAGDGETRERPARDLKPGDRVSFTKPGADGAGDPETVEGTVENVTTDGNITTVTVDGQEHRLTAGSPIESTRPADSGEPEVDSRSRVLDDLRNGKIDQDEARRRIALVDAGMPETFDPDTEDYDPEVMDQSDDELLSNYEAAVEDGDTELADVLQAEIDKRGLSTDSAENDAARRRESLLTRAREEGFDATVEDIEQILEENPDWDDQQVLDELEAYQDDEDAEAEEASAGGKADDLDFLDSFVNNPDDVSSEEYFEAIEMLDAHQNDPDYQKFADAVEQIGETRGFTELEDDEVVPPGSGDTPPDVAPDSGDAARQAAAADVDNGRSVGDELLVIGDTVEIDGRTGNVREIREDGSVVVRWDDDQTMSEPINPDDLDLILDSPNVITGDDFDRGAELERLRTDDEYSTTISLDGEEEYITDIPAVSWIAEQLTSSYGNREGMPADDEFASASYYILEDLDIPVDGDDSEAMSLVLERIDKAVEAAFGPEVEEGGDEYASEELKREMAARGDAGSPLPEGKYPAGDPRNDPDYESYTEELDTKIKQALSDGKDTESQFAVKVGNDVVWTPTRARMHDAIIDELMSQADANGVPQDKTAIMMGGLPGAGKSTFLRQHGDKLGLQVNENGDPTNAIIINPDEMKTLLMNREGAVPRVEGLSDGEHASLVHEESSHLAKMLAARALAGGYNVVFDITLGDGQKAKKKYLTNDAGTGARDLGYKVYAAFVDGDMPTSLHRAGLRHKQPNKETGERTMAGRYVPYGHIMSEAPKPGQTDAQGNPAKSKNRVEYDALVSDGETFDYAIRMDNVTGEFAVDKQPDEDLPFALPDVAPDGGEDEPLEVPDELRAAAEDTGSARPFADVATDVRNLKSDFAADTNSAEDKYNNFLERAAERLEQAYNERDDDETVRHLRMAVSMLNNAVRQNELIRDPATPEALQALLDEVNRAIEAYS